jgi:YidC/Oxa1 family membrane protein insertase
MPDPTPSSPNKPAGKEMSMELRMLLAFGLMGLVLLATQYFMPTTRPQLDHKSKAPAAAAVAQTAPQASAPVASQAGAAAAPVSAAQLPPVAGAAKEIKVIDTDFYRIEFSNVGAAVQSWQLKKYKDADGKPLELMSAAGTEKIGGAFAYIFPRIRPTDDLNKVLFSVKQPDPLTLDFEYSDGNLVARKVFQFQPKSYRFQVRSDVTQAAQGVPHLLSWRAGFGDRAAHNAPGQMHMVYFDDAANKLDTEDAKAAKNGPIGRVGLFQFAGVEDNYFAGLVLPEPGTTLEVQTWSDWFRVKPDDKDETAFVGFAAGGPSSLRLSFFVGPKDLSILRATDAKLDQIIDWGWFWFIAKPLFLSLRWFHDNVASNWGWAIIGVTIIINCLMLPLRYSSMRSMNKMAAIKPHIDELNSRYKNVPMRDPRKQKQNEELMALYSKHGINPMGGCVPMLLQMPFFIAFYKVLSVSIELRNASWLWVGDLSQPEASFIRFLPIGMLVSQVLLQKMSPTPNQDPPQKTMMMMMPVVLSVMFYGASSGLVLYWLTGNVVGIFQQYLFNKAARPVPSSVVIPVKKRK